MLGIPLLRIALLGIPLLRVTLLRIPGRPRLLRVALIGVPLLVRIGLTRGNAHRTDVPVLRVRSLLGNVFTLRDGIW